MSANPSAVAEPARSAESAIVTLEADDILVADTDSALGDDAASIAGSTESLNSGVFKYRYENGRTYHALKDGDYVLPNDAEEQDRLDLQNHVFLLINDGKLFTAPIDNPARVLDVGTGTGIWAIDFADQHPASHVIGNDLSPIQPDFIPPNLQFEVDDVSSQWLHKPFNYIHVRLLGGSLLSYKDMLASAYENLAPGGWVECVEFETWGRSLHNDPDGSGPPKEFKRAPMCHQWMAGVNEAGDKIGRMMNVAPHLKDWMSEIGFANVVENVTMVPQGPWPRNKRQKEIGLYQQANYLAATSAYGAALFTRVLGWSNEEFTVLSAGCAKEIKTSDLQLYSNLRVVYGQKAAAA